MVSKYLEDIKSKEGLKIPQEISINMAIELWQFMSSTEDLVFIDQNGKRVYINQDVIDGPHRLLIVHCMYIPYSEDLIMCPIQFCLQFFEQTHKATNKGGK